MGTWLTLQLFQPLMPVVLWHACCIVVAGGYVARECRCVYSMHADSVADDVNCQAPTLGPLEGGVQHAAADLRCEPTHARFAAAT